MKSIISVLVVFFSVCVSAQSVDVVFRKNNPMPRELQVRVLKAIDSKCLTTLGGNSELVLRERENGTMVSTKYVDQEPGDMDYYYKTTFDSYYEEDGAPGFFGHDVIIVVSEKFSVSNPTIDPLIVGPIVSIGKTCPFITK